MISHKINTYNNDSYTRISRTHLHLKPNWDDVQIFIPIVFYRGNDAIKYTPPKNLGGVTGISVSIYLYPYWFRWKRSKVKVIGPW